MQLYELNEIDEISFELKNGRACIIETDTQLGIISLNEKLIYEIKQRSRLKKLITFLPNANYSITDNNLFKKLADNFWPGPLTLIINETSYRVPNHYQLLKIISKTGPIFSSSANISNQKPYDNAIDYSLQPHFSKYDKDLFLVNGKSNSINPSTIFNVDSGKILRKGLIYEKLKTYLDSLGIINYE